MKSSRSVSRPLFAAALALFALANAAHAVSPRTWSTEGVDGWRATRLDSVGVSSTGEVALALGREQVGEERGVVWCFLRDGRDVLAGTGDGGVLLRLRDGGATEVARVVQPEITALGRDGRGRVLFGAAPDGMLYRLEGDQAAPVVDTPEGYLWSILPDGRDGALLATGNGGKIYRLSGEGRLTLLADTGTVHVFSMIRDGDDLLLATGGPPRVERLAPDGKLTVLYEADGAEVKSLVRAADGALYFAVNADDPQNPDGRLYRRLSTGAVERVWGAGAAYIYAVEAAGNGDFWVATGTAGDQGTLVRVTPGPPSAWVEMLRVPEPQILSLLVEDGRPAWVGTGGVGRAYRVTGRAAPRGQVRSTALDAGSWARWGALSLEAGDQFPGVSIETRSGNTRTADDAWSPWAAVALEGGAGAVPSPSARFLEWRLGLADPGARVAAVRVAYLPANQTPRVNAVEVSALGEPFERSPDRGTPGALGQNLPGGLRIDLTPGQGQGPGDADDLEAAWARRFRSVTWRASDPDDDDLLVTLELREEDGGAWRTLADDLERAPWVWDSATVPDGWYEIRAVASDADANAPEEARTATLTTRPFAVDNTPPTLEKLAVSGGTLSGTAVDAFTAVKRIEWALDGGAWKLARPADGIADSKRETFTIAVGDAGPGAHTAQVRATDRAGNIGVAVVRFEGR